MKKMKRRFAIVMIATILLSVLTVIPVMSQTEYENVTQFIPDVDKATGICKMLYFSTEEEFITQGPEPPDGNPIISDGDLLGPGCVVFARNKKLLEKFDTERDLGLDAADVLDVERFLVAFSTSLDDPNGQFTAGDLLVTNGAVIPNMALLAKFDIQRADLGLDAVHFIGDVDSIIKFLDYASQVSRDEWLKNLPEMLEQYDIDIWFSTEGTAPTPEAPQFLDGDLLSARMGTIVVANADLLPSSVPAGIPDRGVDFGLDAVITSRSSDKEGIQFSTELLYVGNTSFTDGDVLRIGNGVICTNEDVIKCFEPKANFLGLDALSIAVTEQPPKLDIYFADAKESLGSVYHYNTTSGIEETVYTRPSGNLYSFMFHPAIPEKLYYVNANEYKIYRTHQTGLGWTPEEVVYTHDTYVRDLAFAFDKAGNLGLYFSESTGAGGNGKIYKIEDSTASLFYEVKLADVGGFWAGDFAFDDKNNLYLSSGNRVPASIYKVEGGIVKEIFKDKKEPISGFTYKDGSLYYANWRTKIYQLDLSTGRRTAIYSNSARSWLSDVGFREVITSVPEKHALAYIYSTDTTSANSYKSLLNANGYITTLIPMRNVATTDFTEYDVIITGSDTGSMGGWGDSASVSPVQDSSKPIIGLGEGGYALFGQLKLSTGHPHGWHGSRNSIYVVDASHTIFKTPNAIPIPQNKIIQPYTSTQHVAIYLPEIPPNIVVLGREVDSTTHYPLTLERARYLLWSFTASPESMTEVGKDLFINVVSYMTE
jgi:hypothetical protein